MQSMSRLFLRTGRFRDMGYETVFSGPATSQAERDRAEQICMDLKRAKASDGVGILFEVQAAGRAIDEVLAVMLERPLTPKVENKLRNELSVMHRDLLPGLLRAVKLATTVQEAREIMNRELNLWARHIAPLLAVQVAATVSPNSQNWTRGVVKHTWTVAAAISLLLTLLLWFSTRPELPSTSSQEEQTTSQPLSRGNWFSELEPESAENLRTLFPESLSDEAVLGTRRSIAQIHLNIKEVLDAIEPEKLAGIKEAVPEQSVPDLMNFLHSIAALEMPSGADICDPELVCPPVYQTSDVQTLDKLLELYKMLAEAWQYSTETAAPTDILRDVEAYERMVADSGFRRAEIQLRGELHRLNRGAEATALLDPLRKLIDCEIPRKCRAVAAREIYSIFLPL